MSDKSISHSLKESPDSFYEILLNNLLEAVNLLDPDLNVIFWNQAAEKLTGYSESEVLGKPCPKNILLDIEDSGLSLCKHTCPVKQALKDGKTYQAEAYLQHKEGYRLPVIMQIIPILSKKGEMIGALETYIETSPKLTVPQSQEDLQRMNLLDPLTSLGNRPYLEIHINSRLEEMKKFGLSLGVLFIDLDDFDMINETYGSVVGDKIIKMVSQTLGNNVRFFEVVGRWDGEKFVAVLLNMDLSKLDLVANKLRLLVEQSNFREQDKVLKTTVSIGATLAKSSDTSASLIKRAQDLANQSKHKGKNLVSIKLEA